MWFVLTLSRVLCTPTNTVFKFCSLFMAGYNNILLITGQVHWEYYAVLA